MVTCEALCVCETDPVDDCEDERVRDAVPDELDVPELDDVEVELGVPETEGVLEIDGVRDPLEVNDAVRELEPEERWDAEMLVL